MSVTLAGIYVAAILGIREANVGRLAKEDDIRMRIPAVGIERRIVTAIGNTARTKLLEQKPIRGTTAWTTIQAQDKRSVLWRIARLKEPVDQVKIPQT